MAIIVIWLFTATVIVLFGNIIENDAVIGVGGAMLLFTCCFGLSQ